MPDNGRRLNSRLNKPKRKKKNGTILNVLIAFVLLLIIIVVVNIVVDKEPETSKVDDNTSINEETQIDASTNDEEDNADTEKDSIEGDTESSVQTSPQEEDEEENESEEESDSNSSESEQENSVSVPSEDPVVGETVVDPSWAPIGTSQTGEHASSYDKESIDWKEKVQALSYGSGLDPSNMYVKFLGNGGSPQKSVGTVTSKDGKEIYRIHLEWIDGEGWKPTKKEKLTTLEDAS